MNVTRRTLLAGVAGAAALSTLPSLPADALTNTILPGPIPQGGINGETEVHCSLHVLMPEGPAVAIGGSFSSLKLPNGSTVAASNAAIIRLSDHKVLWAASGVNGYVKTVAAIHSVIYWGGTFTTFGGQSRDRLAAVHTNRTLLPWNPRLGSPVRALKADSAAVYVAGAHVWAVQDARANKTGRVLWKQIATTGDCRTLLLHNSSLYVGGLFEKMGTLSTRLAKLSPTTGHVDTAFKPNFRPDNWRGKDVNGYDGDCILSLAAYPGGRVLVGGGGAGRNGIWVMNQNTGKVMSNSAWTYTYKSRSGVYSPPPYQAYQQRNSEGDVQAVAVVGASILTGNHRGHVNFNTDWPTKRMLTAWNQSNGRVVTSFDPGLWGGTPNSSHMNGGVQTITPIPSAGLVVVGGCFKGFGDPYNNTGGADIYGAPGTSRAALVYVRI